MTVLSISIILIIITIIIINGYILSNLLKQKKQTLKDIQEQNKQISEYNKELARLRQELTENQIANSEICKKIDDNKSNLNDVQADIIKLQNAQKEAIDELNIKQKELENYDNNIAVIKDAKRAAEVELTTLKDTLTATRRRILLEQQETVNIEDFKLKLLQEDIDDIKVLENLKKQLNHKEIISKLIWSTFFQKEANALYARAANRAELPINVDSCGVYKITNLITQEVYIGQSKTIQKRWIAHIKCGLGIDTPATVKLYKNMQEYGIWNFSFEILNVCTADKLNELEKYWINAYQSDKIGLNMTIGGAKK
jgi:predicted  nucleic acid-binding Zn-ribbon protein